MNILFENEKFKVTGNVTLSECMNLKVLMNYITKVDAAISELSLNGTKVNDLFRTVGFEEPIDAIKYMYKDIYEALHNQMVKPNKNASAYKAQENTFRQAIQCYIFRNMGVPAKFKMCTVLDANDPMLQKKGLVEGFKLFNSITITVPTSAEYEHVVSTSEFELELEYA